MPCKKKTIDPDLLCDHYNTDLFKSKLENFMRIEKQGGRLLRSINPCFVKYLESYSGLTLRDKAASFIIEGRGYVPACEYCSKPSRYDSHTMYYSKYCSRKCAMKASNLRIRTSNRQKRLDATGFETLGALRKASKHVGPKPALTHKELLTLIENSTSSAWSLIMKNRHTDQLNYIENISTGSSTSEKVYRYLHPDIRDTCHGPGCTNKTSYRGPTKGFSMYCSQKCSHNSAEVKSKTANTCIEKYGVPSIMQNKELMNRQQIAAFKRKDYVFPSGITWSIQGDEGNIITYLLSNGYSEEQLTQDAPVIDYKFAGRRRKHFPDLYIPSENLIIEVKSPFTFEREKNKNEAKISAAIAAGYEYHFYIWNRLDSTVTIIRDLNLPS